VKKLLALFLLTAACATTRVPTASAPGEEDAAEYFKQKFPVFKDVTFLKVWREEERMHLYINKEAVLQQEAAELTILLVGREMTDPEKFSANELRGVSVSKRNPQDPAQSVTMSATVGPDTIRISSHFARDKFIAGENQPEISHLTLHKYVRYTHTLDEFMGCVRAMMPVEEAPPRKDPYTALRP